MQKLVILDYDKWQTHIYSINSNKEPEDEIDKHEYYVNLIEGFGHSYNNCNYIVLDKEEDIISH